MLAFSYLTLIFVYHFFFTCFMDYFFNSVTTIISILSLLVTFLVGWQIYQTIFVEHKIRKIAKEAAKEITKNVSYDLNLILSANNEILASTHCSGIPEMKHKEIHVLFSAVDLLLKCKDSNNSKPMLVAAVNLLQKSFDKNHGHLHLLKGQEVFYKKILEKVNKLQGIHLHLPDDCVYDKD